MDAIWLLIGVITGAALVYFLMRNRVQAAADAKSATVQSKLDASEDRLKERTADYERLKAEHEQADRDIQALKDHLHQGQLEIQSLRSTLESSEQHSEERIQELSNAREQLKKEFQLLANEIFETKGKTFSEKNQEALEHMLTPFREQLTSFRKRVEDVREKEKEDMGGLLKAIEQVQTMGSRLSEDANNLTKALKGDSKQQGDWGEMILDRILTESGLQKGREYDTQDTFRDAEGHALRPDVIVYLPEQKCVVIDSKVSLKHYEQFCSADTADAQKEALKLHLNSLKTHIRGLSDKSYENLPGTRQPEFVLMFVPVEPALLTASSADPNLFNDAFRMRVCLVSPSTLIMTLKIIENIWRTEHQGQNAEEIAKKAGALYDKLVGFVTDLEAVGRSLDKAKAEYDNGLNKLSTGKGNVLRRAEELKTLGASAKKSLPDTIVGGDDSDE